MWQCTENKDTRPDRQPLVKRAPKRWSLLRRLWRDERGATAVEFGVSGILLVYFITAIMEFSAMMTVSNSLEAATNLSSRLGKTGYVEDGSTQVETIRAEIERRVGPLIDMSELSITYKAWKDFGDLDSDPEAWNDDNDDGTPQEGEYTDTNGNHFCDGCSGLGGSDNVVVFTISYPWKIMTPFMSQFVGTDGVITLSALSVVKNEPY
jgi:Flp pilus assembly protein TadG